MSSETMYARVQVQGLFNESERFDRVVPY